MHEPADAYGVPLGILIAKGDTADCCQVKKVIVGIEANFLPADREDDRQERGNDGCYSAT